MNKKIIKIPITDTTTTYTVNHTIQQGDVDAYRLEITFLDLEQISNSVELRFVFPDKRFLDRETTVSGNIVYYDMKTEDYSQLGPLKCFIRFLGDNLYTPVQLIFTGIRALVGNVEMTDIGFSYPEWIHEAKEMLGGVKAAGTYVHHQGVASNLWIITHKLGYNPNITIVDSTGRHVMTEIDYIDKDTARSQTKFKFAGQAYCS